MFSQGSGNQGAQEQLALARAAVDAGSDKEALKALEQALETSKKKGETESLRQISELAEKLRVSSSGSVAKQAAELAYAASQNVRLFERRARISAAGSSKAIASTSDKAAYAGWGSRFGAWLLDWIIIWVPVIVLGIVLRLATGTFDEGGQGPELLVALAALPLAPLYFAFCHAGARGQTLGKRVVNIAVKDESLGRLSLGRALGRAYLTAVLWWAFYIGGVLDALWPLWDSNNQALHDKAVGSIVVETT